MVRPLRRSHLTRALDDTSAVVLHNNSVYLTRRLVDRIGRPDYAAVRVTGGLIEVEPLRVKGARGSGIRKVLYTDKGGGWITHADAVIRCYFGADITVADDVIIPTVLADKTLALAKTVGS